MRLRFERTAATAGRDCPATRPALLVSARWGSLVGTGEMLVLTLGLNRSVHHP